MPSLIDQYRYLHEQGRFPGYSIRRHFQDIANLVCETGAISLLDYGCGKARGWFEGGALTVGLMPTLYDPANKDYAKRPEGKFDGVICTDVLEHVEDPEAVIADLIGYATKFLFISISVKESPPRKRLPDGRPLHIHVHPEQWWRERIKTDLRLELRFDEGS